MSSEKSRGLVYKIIKYSDKSAICFAFTENVGKIRFFLSDAFGKNRTVLKFMPAEFSYINKINTDLHKLLSVEYFTDYIFFHDEPELYMRLNFLFEIIDLVVQGDSFAKLIWSYVMRINRNNYIKAISYIVYDIFLKFDLLFDCGCSICGDESSETICNSCLKKLDLDHIQYVKEFIRAAKNRSDYRNFSIDNDSYILNFFEKVVNIYFGKKIRSFDGIKNFLV
ncbi:MAG: recombination protein O N-terminal domain-containing protein [Calditerrivibrio sp.]|nr:recombination protein O N-terminal domain-containing protein [Calditerrivibrio sp.]